ncbi:hypothetical protein Esti_006845 [Eimeria stiedai]
MGSAASASARGPPRPRMETPCCPTCRPQAFPRGPPKGPGCRGPKASGAPDEGGSPGTETVRCSGRSAGCFPPGFASKLLHAVEAEDVGALSSLLQQNTRGPSKADALAFEGDAGCLHALLAALQQQQQQVLQRLFELGCSVDSTWPAASFFAASGKGPSRCGTASLQKKWPLGGPLSPPTKPAAEDSDEGAPSGMTHLCVQRQPPAAAAAADRSSGSSCSLQHGKPGRGKGPFGGPSPCSSLPAVLQPPKGPTWGWGPLSEVQFFCKKGSAAAGGSEQQEKVLKQLKEAPLLLVGEVGLLYSDSLAVHLLIAELTQQPGRLLVAAAAASSPAVLQRLLQRGANPNFRRHGLFALGVAACCSSAAEEKAKLLLAFGAFAEVPLSPAAAGKAELLAATVTATAAKRLASYALKRCNSFSLRQAGTPTAATTTAAAAADATAEIPSREALEAAGASLGPSVAVAISGETPVLLQAAINRDLNVMQLLLKNGASPDVFLAASGLPTPLFFCVFWGFTPAVRLLLSHGANPFIVKENGEGLEVTAKRALQFAVQPKPRHILKLPLPKTSPAVSKQILTLVGLSLAAAPAAAACVALAEAAYKAGFDAAFWSRRLHRGMPVSHFVVAAETAQRRWASAALEVAKRTRRPTTAAAATATAAVTAASADDLWGTSVSSAAALALEAPLLLKATWETSVSDPEQLQEHSGPWSATLTNTNGTSTSSSSSSSSGTSSSKEDTEDDLIACESHTALATQFRALQGSRGGPSRAHPPGLKGPTRGPSEPSRLRSVSSLFDSKQSKEGLFQGPPKRGGVPPFQAATPPRAPQRGGPPAAKRAQTYEAPPSGALVGGAQVKVAPMVWPARIQGPPVKDIGTVAAATPSSPLCRKPPSAAAAAADMGQQQQQQQQPVEAHQGALASRRGSFSTSGGGSLRRGLTSLEVQLAHLLSRKHRRGAAPTGASGGPRKLGTPGNR